MKYTILIYENEADFATRSDEKRKEAYWGAYRAYTQALTQAGVMIGGAGLQLPGRATMIRLRDGKRQVQGRSPKPRSSLNECQAIRKAQMRSPNRPVRAVPQKKP